jgi:hypothetical protein
MRAQRRLIALVVTLGVLVAAALAGSVGARSGTSVVELLPEVEGLPRALAVQEQNTSSLLDIDGVVGAGVGASATGPSSRSTPRALSSPAFRTPSTVSQSMWRSPD